MTVAKQDYGLTLVYEGLNPTVDIVFVHGLFGKPRSTWTFKNAQVAPEENATATANKTTAQSPPETVNDDGSANAVASAGPSASANDNGKRPKESRRFWKGITLNFKSKPATPTKNVFWPADLLPDAIPAARVFTWGYDVDIDHLLSSAGHATIFQHARQLAQDIADVRVQPELQSRKLIFVAHSLGGIVVKDMLNYAQSTQTKGLKQVLESTFGVIFFGTPHRGSPVATLSKIAHNITKAMGKNPATKTLADLEINSETLDRISTYFKQLLETKKISIHTFQEEMPMYGVMVVPQFSSVFEGYGEETGVIHADHRGMTKFSGASDKGFMRTKAVMERWATEIQDAASHQPPPVTKTPFLVPFARDPDFMGRGDILQSIKAGFEKYPTMALHGLGGIGKSQIAIEYAYQAREDSPATMVLWAHGADANRFRDSYRSIAARLNIPGVDDPNAPILSLVCSTLSDPRIGSWLLILDNVDDISVFKNPSRCIPDVPNARERDNRPLRDYLPVSPNGKILVTSRSKAFSYELLSVPSQACLIAVPPMVSDDCMKLLLSKIPVESTGSEDERQELILELENLPLAISQAAAYINQNSDFINVPKYLEEFRQSESSRLSLLKENIQDLRRDERPNYSVLRTWDMSFEHIQKNWPSSAKMLFIMSIYSSQNIPEKLLMKSISENESMRTVLGPLRQFHLITVHADLQAYDLHRFVQLATRTYLQNIDELGRFRSIGVMALLSSLENIPALPPMELRLAYMNYLSHANEVSEHEFTQLDDIEATSQLLSRMAVLWTNSGDPWKGLAASARAIEMSKKYSNPGSAEIVTRLAVHGYCLIESGNPAMGESILREMFVAVDSEATGDDWKNHSFLAFVIRYRCQLAISLELQSKFAGAIDEVKRTLELIDSAELGLQDSLYQLRIRLCNSLWQQQRLIEARELAEKFLTELQSTAISNSAYYMFQLLRLLLNISMQTRRYGEAETILVRLESMIDTQFGDKSFNGIMMLHDKAILKMRLNECDAALGEIEKLEAITKEIYGDGMPSFLLTTLSVKGEMLEKVGRYNEALALREKLLRNRTEAFTPYHRHTIRARIAVASSLSAMGQIERALEVVQEPIATLRRMAEPARPEAALCMVQESDYLMQLGRSKEAISVSRMCVQMCKDLPESELEVEMTCLFNFGCQLKDTGLYEEASRMFRLTLDKMKTIRPEVDGDISSITEKLAVCLENSKEAEAAELLFRQMLQATTETLGPRHDETFLWQQRLACFLNRQKKFEEAERIFKEALEGSKTALGSHHFRSMAIQADTALHYRDCGKPELAETLDREALKLRQEAEPLNEFDVFQSMNNLAMTLHDLERHEEAAALLVQSIEGRIHRFGGCNKETDFYRANLLTVRMSQGDWSSAETLCDAIIDFRTHFFGPCHTDTLSIIKKRVWVWDHTQQWQRMMDSFDDIMALYNEGCGSQDAETVSVRIRLCRAFCESGMMDKAEVILLPVYDMVVSGGISATDASFFSLRYGTVLRAKRRFADMEEFARQVISMMETHFPEAHDGHSSPKIILTNALELQGRFLEAARVQHQVCLQKEVADGYESEYFQTSLRVYFQLVASPLGIDEATLKDLCTWKEKLLEWCVNPGKIRESLVILARVLRNQDHPDSLDIFRICLRHQEDAGPNKDQLKLMSAKKELQWALTRTERRKEALNVAKEMQGDWRQYLASHPEAEEPVHVRILLGYSLIYYGRWYEAETLAEALYNECRNKNGEDHNDTLDALRLFGAAQLACGRYIQAVERYSVALGRHESKEKTSSVLLSIARGMLIEAYIKAGAYDKAKALADEPFVNDAAYSGPRKRYEIRAKQRRSAALTKLGQLDEAMGLAVTAFIEFELLLGPNAEWTIESIVLVAQIHFERGELTDAEEYGMRAIVRCRRLDVLHNALMVNCQILLGRIYTSQGLLERSLVMFRRAWIDCMEMYHDDHPTLMEAQRETVIATAKCYKSDRQE